MRHTRFGVFLVFVGLVLSLQCVAAPLPPLPNESGSTYLNAQRTDYARIGSHVAHFGEFDADDAVHGEYLVDTGSAAFVRDCSDQRFRCRQVSDMVFAVPQAGLSKSASYTVAGAQLTVEKCYRVRADSCIIALIGSNCMRSKTGSCSASPNTRDADTRSGPLVYFIFNWRYGVTAFGFGDKPTSDLALSERIAQTLMLQGNDGLLRY